MELHTRIFMTGDPNPFWVEATPDMVAAAVRDASSDDRLLELVTTPYASGERHTVYIDPARVAAIAPLEPAEVGAATGPDDDEEAECPD